MQPPIADPDHPVAAIGPQPGFYLHNSTSPASASNAVGFRVASIFTIPSDFDSDGDVDGADFLSWQLNDVSESGLADWQATFGNAASPITATSTGVPEPTTWLLMMLGMAALLFRRHLEAL